ncbi:hypothetical protein [Streptomyces sp. NPDC012510]|uniref:hypothetical protein n=1 Tax=Streptomyces sp. NPDC012510 TaxID=3364838 RepID=UPI0036EEC223
MTAPLPKVRRLPFAPRGQHVDISGRDFVQPADQRPPGTATWFDRLPVSVNTRLDWVLRLRPLGLMAAFAAGYAWDGADTTVRRLRARRRPGGSSRTATSHPREDEW